MSIAEYVTKVHAICMRCGHIANHSHRVAGGESLIQLGEKDSYEPLCRDCFRDALNAEQPQL
jgi:thymidine kinase